MLTLTWTVPRMPVPSGRRLHAGRVPPVVDAFSMSLPTLGAARGLLALVVQGWVVRQPVHFFEDVSY